MFGDGASLRLRARWIFPLDQPPIEDATVIIENGRIVRLASGRDADAVDLGDAAIIPGLVNAHTHLEFSHLKDPVAPKEPFPAWIRGVIGVRRSRDVPVERVLRDGLQECGTTGTTLLGEIATADAIPCYADAANPGAVVFREVLGISADAEEAQLAVAKRHLALRSADSQGITVHGLSPHAPYSTSAELFRANVQLAVDAGAPVSTHLAETPAELELLQHGTGPFSDMLKSFGIWRDQFWFAGNGVQPYLEVLSKAARALVIHGNYLAPSEIAYLSRHPQMTVVYCPRTHRYFRHAPHGWREMLEQGVSVALGTDSRASNPDLSLWNELLFLRKEFPDVSPEMLLNLATRAGAVALGFGDTTGTLRSGRSADIAVVGLCGESLRQIGSDPYSSLLHAGNRVCGVMRRGCWIGRR